MGVIKKLVKSVSVMLKECETIFGYWGIVFLDYFDILINLSYG